MKIKELVYFHIVSSIYIKKHISEVRTSFLLLVAVFSSVCNHQSVYCEPLHNVLLE